MALPSYARPENVVKNAENLIKIGNTDEALSVLKTYIGSKNFKYITSSEAQSVGLLYAELCVEKRDITLAKEGLFNYKRNVQTISNGLETVHVVVKKFIQLSEESLKKETAKYDLSSSNADDDIDLDEAELPELLLSDLHGDDVKEKSDRENLTPSLRFMFNAYKTVIEIIRNTNQLEVAYCAVINQCFKFCEQFNRKHEFRRISDLVRYHLQSINQYANMQNVNAVNAANQVNLSNVHTFDRFLQLRFNGLNIAMKMELYQESFKIVEDIHILTVLSKRQPKPQMMLNYYENLAKIFNVSGNSLYRSVSWLRFFNLYSQSPNATIQELNKYASLIVLSCLSIEEDSSDNVNYKYKRLNKLLSLKSVPTRDSVIESINKNSFLRFVDSDLKKLFHYLENDDFNPLLAKQELTPLLSIIYENVEFRGYLQDLIHTVLLKVFKQISKNYDNITYDFLIDLCCFKNTSYQLTPEFIENALINSGKQKTIGGENGNYFTFSIDHDSNLIHFKEIDGNFGDIQLNLQNISNTLLKSLYNIDDTLVMKQQAIKEKNIAVANEEIMKERQAIEERNRMLEQRKKEEAEAEARRLEELKKERELKAKMEKQAELDRIETETKRREQEEVEKKKLAIDLAQVQEFVKLTAEKGLLSTAVKEAAKTEVDMMKLKKLQMSEINKDIESNKERVAIISKKYDHLERAMRKCEQKYLQQDSELQKDRDLKAYNEITTKLKEKAKSEYDATLMIRDRFSRILPKYEEFKTRVVGDKLDTFKKLQAENSAKLEAAKQARITEIKEQRLKQMIETAEHEARELDERKQREAEIARKEEAEKSRKEKLAKIKADKEAKDREILERQREMELAVERKLQTSTPVSSGSKYVPPGRRNNNGNSNGSGGLPPPPPAGPKSSGNVWVPSFKRRAGYRNDNGSNDNTR